MQALLSATVMRVSECQSAGIDTAEMRVLIHQAKEALRAGNYAQAMNSFSACDALARASRTLQRETYDAISETAGLVREAQRGGVEVSGFLGALLQAKTAFSRSAFAEARELADRVRADLEQLQP